MADLKATVSEYQSKAQSAADKAKEQITTAATEVANVAKQAANELRSTATQLVSAVKGTAEQQLQAAKAGGALKAQFEAQKTLVANYVAPLKAAGNNVSSIAGNVKNGLVAVAK